MSREIDPIYQSTHNEIVKQHRKYRLTYIGAALLQLFLVAVITFLAYFVLEVLFDLSTPIRWTFWIILASAVSYFSYRYFYPNFRRAFSPTTSEIDAFSKKIGKSDPKIQDALINFLQIYRNEDQGVSPLFKNLSLKQLSGIFDKMDFSKAVDFSNVTQPGKKLVFGILALAIISLLFPSETKLTAAKLLSPSKDFVQPLPIQLVMNSGNLTVLKNESAELVGEYIGERPKRLWLTIQSQLSENDSIVTEKIEIPIRNDQKIQYTLRNVRSDATYYFEATLQNDVFRDRIAISNSGTISVKERPYVQELQVKLTYPKYTRLPENMQPLNDGEVTALVGTSVKLNVEANKMLKNAFIQFADSSRQDLQIAANRAMGEFVIKNDTQYQIVLNDEENISNYQPVKYAVFAVQDERPFIEITRPGQDLELDDNLTIPLFSNMRDDFGFSKLELKGIHVKAGSNGDTATFSLKMPIQRLDPSRAVSEFSWDLMPFFLVPDDYIEYYAEIWDNDQISGRKSARSQIFVLRLPSLNEILARSDESLDKTLEETQKVADEARKIKEKLEEINREMKREETLTWERKQQIQEQSQKQQENLQKMQELREELENVVNELEQRDVLSPETLEKYFELQKMMQELATPEMMEAMQKMQKALEKADMKKLKEAMEAFEMNMEQFEERIERTHELFKRVQLEQKMDELNKMAESLVEEQKEINEQLEQNAENQEQNPENQEQLANKQENLSEESEALKEALEQAQKEFAEMMSEISEELNKAENFMSESQISEQMQNMQQQMQSGENQKAQESGKSLQEQLEMLQSMMNNAREQMKQQQQQEMMQAMQKVQQDLLRGSQMQERLMQQSRNADMASSKLTEMASQQSQLRENANNTIQQMMDISKKSFFMEQGMSETMQQMMQNMEQSLANFANRNPRGASKSQEKALGSYNEAIMSMQNSMNSMMQSGSGTGFEQFMQQLQQMAGQQGQLNKESMGMMPQPGQNGQQPGGPSPGEMGRMAQQQQMIRDALEKLNQGMGGNKKDVLGRLDQLGEEMEKVVEALQQQQINPKVIERQQRILSRLLDAQQSIREKERSEKREAERGKNAVAKSPPQLKKEIIERESELRKEMLRALQEGYSTEYKTFIKMYYEKLSRERAEK